MFGNGGMVGTSVALSNALGLDRDPPGTAGSIVLHDSLPRSDR